MSAPLRHRVLIVHNAYQQRGGEDAVVDAELALLRQHGHAAEVFYRHNDDLKNASKARAAMDAVWSISSARALTAEIDRFRPDVVHVHNTFPLISPAAYWAVRAAGLPVVQTLHNFRLHCPQAMYLRKEKVCEDCLGRLPWRSVQHGCYRGSSTQSAVLTGMLAMHGALGTYRNKVTRYIALNDFCRRKFIAGGLPAGRIVVKPNFVDFPAPDPVDRNGFLFVGRLSAEKGIDVLVRAWRAVGSGSLQVAGTGPEAPLLQGVPGLDALGALASDAVRDRMFRAAALVVPSIWYETFGLVVIEAYASCTPVIVSRIGALAELVEDGVTGLLFEPGNADDLAQKMRWAQTHPAHMAEMGRNARKKYEAEFSAEKNYPQLIAIYDDAIAAVARGE